MFTTDSIFQPPETARTGASGISRSSKPSSPSMISYRSRFSPPYCPSFPLLTLSNLMSCVNCGVLDSCITSTVDDAYSLPDIATMKPSEIKKELDQYGVSSRGLFEKSELEEALLTARTASPPRPPTKESSRRSTREEKLSKEIDEINCMKVSEIKRELREVHNIYEKYFEKSDYIKTLAEARVVLAERSSGGNTDKPKKDKDVHKSADPMKTNLPVDPTLAKKSNNNNDNGFFSSFTNSMQNLHTVSMLLKNAQHLMKDPRFVNIVQKAQTNPKVMAALIDCMNNPSNFSKYQNDPEINEFLMDLKQCM